MYHRIGRVPKEATQQIKEVAEKVIWKRAVHGYFHGTVFESELHHIKFLRDTFGDKPWVQQFFLKIPPGGSIHKHVDRRQPENVTYHIPIQTNKKSKCLMHEPDEEFSLLTGSFYYVDRDRLHSSINEGKTDRIHLLIEVNKEGLPPNVAPPVDA